MCKLRNGMGRKCEGCGFEPHRRHFFRADVLMCNFILRLTVRRFTGAILFWRVNVRRFALAARGSGKIEKIEK